MNYNRPAVPGQQPEGPEQPSEYRLLVVGDCVVGGATKGEEVKMTLTKSALAALIEAGHVVYPSESQLGRARP